LKSSFKPKKTSICGGFAHFFGTFLRYFKVLVEKGEEPDPDPWDQIIIDPDYCKICRKTGSGQSLLSGNLPSMSKFFRS